MLPIIICTLIWVQSMPMHTMHITISSWAIIFNSLLALKTVWYSIYIYILSQYHWYHHSYHWRPLSRWSINASFIKIMNPHCSMMCMALYVCDACYRSHISRYTNSDKSSNSWHYLSQLSLTRTSVNRKPPNLTMIFLNSSLQLSFQIACWLVKCSNDIDHTNDVQQKQRSEILGHVTFNS